MSDIVQCLRAANCAKKDRVKAADEIERLRADKEAISQTASDYLHKLERLRAALEGRIQVATDLQMKLAAERERCAQRIENWYEGDDLHELAAEIRKG